MSFALSKPCTAFKGHRLLTSGPLSEVAIAVKTVTESGLPHPVLVFDDQTGKVIDLDLRGTPAEVLQRVEGPPTTFVGHYRPPQNEISAPKKIDEDSVPRGRGRPKLGVVAREITLLPRQWDWLAAQPGGASAVVRRLVDEARKSGGERQRKRAAQEAAYEFMMAIGGDFPGYEEAIRALFADDRARLERWTADWPQDIRLYMSRLAFGTEEPQNIEPTI